MRKSACLLPLALGTFGLGLTEYVMMGILPDTAKAMGVSIPAAGNFISFYALGVVFGSILLVIFGRSKPLKSVLLVLVSVFTIANLLTAFANNYFIFCLLRFIAGLPHGSFFGVGAIVADKLADRGKGNFSWRLTFLLVGVFGFLVLYSIIRMIPHIAPLPDTGFRGQFRIFKSLAPWLLIVAVIMGNGGIFCWYSYINPLLVKVSHIAPQYVSLMMILAGAGMCVGNFYGGKLSDKFSPSIVAGITQLIACMALVLIFFFSSNAFVSVFLMCVCTACLFAVSAPQQLLLIKNAKGGEMLGASCSQISFNLGNAIGAYVGGLPIEHGLGYNYTAFPGAVFAFIGFAILFYFYKRYEYKRL